MPRTLVTFRGLYCLLVAFFGCALTTTPTSAQDQSPRRPMTTDDGLRMKTLTSALLSKDGSGVVYGVSELDWDANKRNTKWHFVPADSGESYPFLGKDGGTDLRLSPNGTFLALKRTVEKKAQLFTLRVAGGEAQQLTKHKESVGAYRWAPDGKSVFFVANNARSAEEEKEHANGNDAIIVDEGPNGQREGRWQSLWMATLPDGKITRLTRDSVRIGAISPSPDGRHVALSIRAENLRNQGNLSEVHLYSVGDSSLTRVTNNAAPEGRLIWTPDSQGLTFTAADTASWELRNSKIWLRDMASGKTRLLSGEFTGNIGTYAFTPDGATILFNGLYRTNRNLYALDVASGAVVPRTDVTGSLDVMSFSKDLSRMAYRFSSTEVAPDLYTSPTARLSPTRLTDLNTLVRDSLLLAKSSVIQWPSTDGTQIEGRLLLPPNQEDGPAPLLLHIHGGPAGVFTNRFSYRDHVWGGLGYAQLMPNVRGSSGYDDELLRGNMGDLGGGDYQDLMTGVDRLVEDGIADPAKLAVRGWSYGGILGGWTITQTNRFKAASVGAMVSDWTSEYGPGFNFDVKLWYLGGSPWENGEFWRERSALTHAHKVQTPTLLLHGMNDTTDTEPQSMMFFTAIRDAGNAPVRYIRFPREPHGFREPRHQRTRDVEEIRWIHEHVQGAKWEAWEPPAKSKEKKPATE
jgi:dipeptidyl aminopeptidase/acylaminoacyl peptidase